jgi:hypothetical protein
MISEDIAILFPTASTIAIHARPSDRMFANAATKIASLDGH